MKRSPKRLMFPPEYRAEEGHPTFLGALATSDLSVIESPRISSVRERTETNFGESELGGGEMPRDRLNSGLTNARQVRI